MKLDGEKDRGWSEFWARFRRDCADSWRDIRGSWDRERDRWWETTAEIRQARQLDRRMQQRITGLHNPTRRQVRRVLHEHLEDGHRPS